MGWTFIISGIVKFIDFIITKLNKKEIIDAYQYEMDLEETRKDVSFFEEEKKLINNPSSKSNIINRMRKDANKNS